MKKIYTATFHRANNYGAVLQAYALQKVLLENNYDTEILDYDNKKISAPYRIFAKIDNNFIKSIKFSFKNIFFYNKIKKRNKNFDEVRQKLKMSKYFFDAKSVYDIYEKGATFIVGSDQIWNPNLTGNLDTIYTLNFNDKNIRRIAYAASTGSTDNIKNYLFEMSNILSNFDSISVREKQLQLLLSKNINKNIELVLDPTLLIDKKDWIEFASKKRMINEKYIFTYEVGNPNELFYYTVNELANKTGLKVVYFGKQDIKNNYKCSKESCYTAGPMEWVNLLLNAEYVVTTSFHGTALSMVLNKIPFIILSTSSNRITSLLDLLNLDRCIVKSRDDFERVFKQSINWKDVNSILEINRNKSIDWLITAIGSKEL